MSRSSPSLLALLGLVAVAGYQNRDRLGNMLSDAGGTRDTDELDQTSADGGFLSDITQRFGSAAGSGSIPQAIGELVERFRASGRDAAADSWVSDGPNQPIDIDELETALGHDVVSDLAKSTGLDRRQLLLRLNTALPEVVNRLTPQGRLPTDDDRPAHL